MSAEKETLQRVQGGLYHLQRGLTPFVEGRMKSAHAANWLNYASRASGGAAPLALGVMLAFVPLLVRGVIVPAVKVFAVRSWNSQCKRKSTSKQKGKTPKECVSNANTHSDLLSKGTAATLASWQLHPTFIRGKWESLIIRLHQRCIFGHEGCFSTEISSVPH